MGGSISQWLAYLLPDPAAPGSIPSIPLKFSEEKVFDIAEVNQRRWLEECGHWLENVDQTYLVVVSGKQVL